MVTDARPAMASPRTVSWLAVTPVRRSWVPTGRSPVSKLLRHRPSNIVGLLDRTRVSHAESQRNQTVRAIAPAGTRVWYPARAQGIPDPAAVLRAQRYPPPHGALD